MQATGDTAQDEPGFSGKCDNCDGTGEIWWDALDWGNEHTTHEAACGVCSGTGRNGDLSFDDEDTGEFERVVT